MLWLTIKLKEITNIAEVSNIIPITTDITVSTLLKSDDILSRENKSDIVALSRSTTRHIKSSAKSGKNIAAQAITP